MWNARRLLLAGAVALCGGAVGQAAEPVDFERDVRPLLFSRCVACHGPGKAEAGLRLDSRQAATTLLDSGERAFTPGNAAHSEALRRVRSADADARMPPKGPPLSADETRRLEAWIADGAPWPEHWAYRPLVRPDLPEIPAAAAAGARNEIDRFVRAAHTPRGLAPSEEADRRTLLRRVTFDLLGLPPTADELAGFLADDAPDAYERVVDRLLASPHFGERWARHWMDVAHFAETHGQDQDRPREHAWRYRDYLVRAFNEDVPYGRFVAEQVAGDVLFPDEPWATVATGFLAAGPWDESSLRDIREDSLDRQIGRYLDRDDILTTACSTFLSASVHCARCHDHKFDPISQREYYGLQAVFAGTDKGNRAFDASPAAARRRQELTALLAGLAARVAAADPALLAAQTQADLERWVAVERARPAPWMVLAPQEARSLEGATLAAQPDGSYLSSGKRPEKDTYLFVAPVRLSRWTGLRLEVLTDPSLAHQGPGRQDNGNLHLSEVVVRVAPLDRPEEAKPVAIAAAQADFDQQGWTAAHAIDGNPATAWGVYPEVGKPHQVVFAFRDPPAAEGGLLATIELRQLHGGGHLIGRPRLSVTSADRPAAALAPLPPTISAIVARPPNEWKLAERLELTAWRLRSQWETELAALPGPELVYCGSNRFQADGAHVPAAKPRSVRVLHRGNILEPRDEASPGALSFQPSLPGALAIGPIDDDPPRRAALARWLSDPQNGLVWRSIANRLWHYHFGRGLVDTPNEFGRLGSPPTHPELLDWLAARLRDQGGSLKSLHRALVTSAAYRQSSRHDPARAARDGDNRFLWRMNRRRLDAESLHDAVLAASGQLDRRQGGPSVKQFTLSAGVHVTPNVDYFSYSADDPGQRRRSVYRFLFRTLPDPFMEALDCPDSSQWAPRRQESVSALQALALLNDKFLVRQSERLAERLAAETPEPRAQIERLFQATLLRAPAAAEAEAVTGYSQRHGLANACRLLLNANEFLFID